MMPDVTTCPRCGSTKRNKTTLRCVCGADVTVDGQQPMFDMEEKDERDDRGDGKPVPSESRNGQAQLHLWA